MSIWWMIYFAMGAFAASLAYSEIEVEVDGDDEGVSPQVRRIISILIAFSCLFLWPLLAVAIILTAKDLKGE